MRKKCILISLLLPMTLMADANNTYAPRDYSIIPPSPEVSSLIKYNDISVSNFNGLPNISLPIYTLQEGALSVPISASYHGGGIMMTEDESNLGLGWTLMAGAVISRTIYGHPDDITHPGKMAGLFHADANDKNLRNFLRNADYEYDPINMEYYVQNRINIGAWGANYAEGKSDMANDIFKISGMGLSGTFIFNDNKQLVLSSPIPLKIAPSNVLSSYPNEFIITDVDGTNYYFSKKENTRYEYYYGANSTKDSLNYTSAWHLTKIKNIHNDSIIFHYREKGFKYRSGGIVQTEYHLDNVNLSSYSPVNVASRGSVKYYPQVLTAIESSSAIVRFTYNEYTSNSGSKNDEEVVTKITIHTNDDAQTIVKEYNFQYEYYNNSSIDSYDNASRPLMLTSIMEQDQSLYKLGYNVFEESDATNDIPFVEYDQDFCGYFNGAGNTTLVPQYSNYPGGDAIRDIDPQFSAIGTLKFIEYPTGGRTEFTWEQNDYGYIDSAPVEAHISTNTNKIVTDTLVGLLPPELRKLEIDNFTITSSADVYLDLTQYFGFNPQILMTTDYEHYHEYNEITINDPNAVIYPMVVFINKATGQIAKEGTFYLDENTIEEKYNNALIKVQLPAGLYKIVLRHPIEIVGAKELIEDEFSYDRSYCGRIYISRYYHGTSDGQTYVTKDNWGGLRIASITSEDGSGLNQMIKDYYYGGGDPSCSYGVVPTLPDFTSQYYLYAPKYNAPGYDCTTVYATSSQGLYNLPIGNVGVEYPCVLETYSEIDTTSGMRRLSKYVRSYYSSQKQSWYQDYNPTKSLDYQPSGSQMWTSVAHRRGNLLSICVNDTDLRRTDYEYNIYEPETLSQFTTDLFRLVDFTRSSLPGGYTPTYAYDYSIGVYSLIPYNKTVKSETISNRDGSTNRTDYSYFYDQYTPNIDYNLVKCKTVTSSTGETRQTYYTYKYINGSYLNLPETEVTVVDGIIVDARFMEYYQGTYLLKATYSLGERGKSASNYNLGNKSASASLIALINRPEYSYEYDSHGNLSEISYNGEVLASYLWGYRGLYPILEVKNMPYEQLTQKIATLGYIPENFLAATATNQSMLTSFYNNVRQLLGGYDVTTMTYHWLIGVSTATDSRGVSTHFTYDDFGRLSGAKDYNQYFIRKYDYHYKE